MATIRKRSSKWQVQIRRAGHPNLSKSFLSKQDASRWARETERLIDRGENLDGIHPINDQPFSEILTRYEREVTSAKRSEPAEHFHLKVIFRHPIARLTIANLTPASICQFRDDRLRRVSGSTVRKELTIIQHSLKVAHSEWAIPVRPDVLKGIRKPPSSRPRNRRLEAGDFEAICAAIQKCRNQLVRPTVLFALATGMRRGELLSLAWHDIDISRKTAYLDLTKNGEARTVPLSPAALKILTDLKEDKLPGEIKGRIFPLSPNALRLAWDRIKKRSEIKDLHFHDLRHEAISRFFELGLSIPEVSLISGHKDVRMLFRYTHLKPNDVANKLKNLMKSDDD